MLRKNSKSKSISIADEEIDFIMRNSFWNREQIVEMFKKFISFYPNGKLNRNEFKEIFKEENISPRILYRVFNAIDKNEDDCIDFSEALLSYTILYDKSIIQDILYKASSLYKINNTNSKIIVCNEKEVEIIIDVFFDSIFRRPSVKIEKINKFQKILRFINLLNL
jgi:hypothetical protein